MIGLSIFDVNWCNRHVDTFIIILLKHLLERRDQALLGFSFLIKIVGRGLLLIIFFFWYKEAE